MLYTHEKQVTRSTTNRERLTIPMSANVGSHTGKRTLRTNANKTTVEMVMHLRSPAGISISLCEGLGDFTDTARVRREVLEHLG